MMKHLIRTVLSTTSLFALSIQMFAGDWPQWRGADRNDISSETGLLVLGLTMVLNVSG